VDPDFAKLPKGKKLFFASDFHLGAVGREKSIVREKRIIRWLDSIKDEAAGIFFVGDIFDFWFEYDHVIPKGFIRFQGKLASLRDMDIPMFFFRGNHDMWMYNYFQEELEIPIYSDPISFQSNSKSFYVGHGDGLGPGDKLYKLLKYLFRSKVCQWMFKWLHPNVGMAIAQAWSKKSRLSKGAHETSTSFGEEEWLFQHASSIQAKNVHDFYVFGHRHLPMEMSGPGFRYVNLGEWVHHNTYAEFDGKNLKLLKFEG